MKQFTGQRSAEAAAKEMSLKDPSQTYYVGWIEDNEWCVETVPENEGQRGWCNGEVTYHGAMFDDVERTVWLTDTRGMTP